MGYLRVRSVDDVSGAGPSIGHKCTHIEIRALYDGMLTVNAKAFCASDVATDTKRDSGTASRMRNSFSNEEQANRIFLGLVLTRVFVHEASTFLSIKPCPRNMTTAKIEKLYFMTIFEIPQTTKSSRTVAESSQILSENSRQLSEISETSRTLGHCTRAFGDCPNALRNGPRSEISWTLSESFWTRSENDGSISQHAQTVSETSRTVSEISRTLSQGWYSCDGCWPCWHLG